MAADIAIERLGKISILADWPREQLAELLTHCELQTFAAGETIVGEGAEERALYFLLEGSAKVGLYVTRVGEEVLADLSAGSVFGEVSFFHAAKHSATIRCLEAATVLKLTRAKYDELKRQGSVMALRLGASTAELLADLLQRTNVWMSQHLTDQADRLVLEMWSGYRDRVRTGYNTSGGFHVT
jgi:CRP/FNR family cyclic AMP-dependent transcriptional regulator